MLRVRSTWVQRHKPNDWIGKVQRHERCYGRGNLGKPSDTYKMWEPRSHRIVSDEAALWMAIAKGSFIPIEGGISEIICDLVRSSKENIVFLPCIVNLVNLPRL